MKKFINLCLIYSLIFSFGNLALAAEVPLNKVAKKEKDEKVHIVKPEKTKKINLKRQKKQNKENAKTKQETSKEAEGMYETKFPTINSKIEYTDMNG